MTVSFVIEGGQSDYLPHAIEAQLGQLPLGINRTSDLEEHQEIVRWSGRWQYIRTYYICRYGNILAKHYYPKNASFEHGIMTFLA